MAGCDKGYLCADCGEPVEEITESDLYLRFVIGQIETESLLSTPERHIRCNPITAQFIVDPDFKPVVAEGASDKRELDPEDVRIKETLITRGWRRLQEIPELSIPLDEYPLTDIRANGS